MLAIHHGVPSPHAQMFASFSDFYLIEAGEYIRNELYAAWCRKMSHFTADVASPPVVLDNGVGIGDPVEWCKVLDVAAELETGYIVLPDELYSRDATLNNARRAIDTLVAADILLDRVLVIQGDSEGELLNCLDEVISSDLSKEIEVIGIPFRMWPDSPNDTRFRFVQSHIAPVINAFQQNIHLFGCRYMSDFTLTCCDFIDTRMAFKYAVKSHLLEHFTSPTLPSFKNTMDMQALYPESVCKLAESNMQYLNLIRDMATKMHRG